MTTVARDQLCGHVVSPATREHAIMEETFSVRSVLGLCNEEDKSLVVILKGHGAKTN
jgi:hypothetical protein